MFLFRRIDDFLSNITMYRLMVYGLLLLFAVAGVYMASGVLSYSLSGFLITSVIVLSVCFVANMGFARLFRITANHESGLITALILCLILPQTSTLQRGLYIALTGVLAMAVKYVLVWRGSHFLNPAAAGAAIVSLAGLVPITWWIANPSMVPVTLVVGLLILRKTRRFTLFLSFAGTASVMTVLVSLLNGQAYGPALSALLLSYPLLFLGMIMLTEPTTLPAGRVNIVLYAVAVGVLFASHLEIGAVAIAPHLALLIGNIFSVVVSPKRGTRLKLVSKQEIASNQYEFVFSAPLGVKIPYAAGQYMEWTVPGVAFDSRGNRRTFTIASSPTEGDIRLGTKSYSPSSAYKRRLLELNPGDHIIAGHIGGSFTLPFDMTQKMLWVAGGIGITPFRSMVQYLIDAKQSRDVVLIYCAASEKDFAYREVLRTAERYGVKTFYFTGTLTDGEIVKYSPDFRERTAYISGPQGMVRGLESVLTQAGVRRTAIRTDLFSGL